MHLLIETMIELHVNLDNIKQSFFDDKLPKKDILRLLTMGMRRANLDSGTLLREAAMCSHEHFEFRELQQLGFLGMNAEGQVLYISKDVSVCQGQLYLTEIAT
ncbi:hypothetical protein [Rhodococcus sovatensis]|uniref:Uncharacterized protein n=1 Tax=Rhodococcus sovatensis TaxID=1805840 RepID=A0ABZ2PNF3_9NOCA